jgi:hypothetical protein
MPTIEEMRAALKADEQKQQMPSIEEMRAILKADEKPQPSNMKDIGTSIQRGMLFGARPFVAGVAGGLGSLAGGGEFGSAYSEARKQAQEEEADIGQRRPGLQIGADITGAVLTAPLTAVRGVTGAAKVGAAMGAAQAAGHAENLKEAATMIGGGALMGAGGQAAGDLLAKGISKAAPAVKGFAGKISKKTASALTGIPEQEIATYAKRADQVKKLIDQSGGDISLAADKVRERVMKDIQVTRQNLGNQIGDALSSEKYAGTMLDVTDMVKSLDDSITKVSKVSAQFRPNEIAELKNVRDTVKQFVVDGKISIQDLNSVKQELQNIATPSYMAGAAIFPKGDLAAKASKGAAAEAKRLIDAAAPEIKQANSQLSKLHNIEREMNKNLIKAGKPEAALLAAGSGSNKRSEGLLAAIDRITKGNALEQAQNLAAGRTFSNVPLLPVDTTGKAAARMLAAGAAGTAIGSPLLGAAGAALTSPASLKGAIHTQRFLERLADATSKKIPEGIGSNILRGTAITQGRPLTAEERRLEQLKNRGQ